MQSPWWSAKKRSPDLAQAIWTRIDRLRSRRRADNLRDLIHEAIYRGRPLGVSEGGVSSSAWSSRSAPAIINIARAKTDAIASRMSKHRPFPCIPADAASWSEKRFAKRVSSVLRARLSRTEIERDRTLRIRDAIIRGTGVAKIVRTDNGDVSVERTPRSEIIVSAREAQYGCPRNLFQVKSYPTETLAARFEGSAKAIYLESRPSSRDDAGWYEWGDDWADDSEQVTVAEAWHLPSGYDADDGRHVITIRNKVLLDEPWTRPRFPFAFLHWSPPLRGLWGSGLIEDLSGVQAKINDVARDIQEALYYGAQLTVFVPRGANIKKEHLRSRHPHVVETDGPTPIYSAPLPVSPQLFQFLDWLLAIADDLSGLARDFQRGSTQLGAGASGKAIDTLDDIQSDRFAMFQLHDSLHMVDVGAAVVDEARAIAEELPKSEQAAWIREHKWTKVRVDEGLHHLRLEPINFLPDTRAGKLSTVSQLGEAGLISDPSDMLDLFDEPDLTRPHRQLLGPLRIIERVLEGLAELDTDFYELTPDNFFPLEKGIAAVRAQLCDAWAAGEEDEILERHREWIRLAEAKLDEISAASAPPPQVPDPGMAPGPEALPPELAGAPAPEMAVPPMAVPGMM